ncbi:MAG TPA: 30S ribosomal protein S20 [Candidatus Paceibacterota bacterium]
MPITSSAKKALRSSRRKRVFNDKRKDALKASLKAIRALIATGKKSEAEKLLSSTFQSIDKAAKKGVIKKGNAARKKSRLAHSLVSK